MTAITGAGVENEALRRIERWLASEQEQRRRLAFDAAGRLCGVEEADDCCAYAYDARNDLIEIREAGGVARFAYDDRRRLTHVSHPGGEESRYAYGDNDRLAEIDDRGVIHRFAHDAAGRLVRSAIGASGAAVFRYDAGGRVTEARTAEVSERHEYDAAGRLAVVHQTIDGVTLSVRLGFDDGGRLAEMRLPGIEARPVRYTWDARGRPATAARTSRPLWS